MELNTILITQARTGSKRLPGKILNKISGKSLLEIHLERLKKCKMVSNIIVATTDKPHDNIIYKKTINLGLNAYRGSENNVLDRFYKAALDYKPDWIVRVTSDCPLIDPQLVDDIITFTQKQDVDYGSNVLVENYPDGQDVEVFKFSTLETAWKNANLKSEKEHVTPFIINNSDFNGGIMFSAVNFPNDYRYSKIRMTVDELQDFELMKILIEDLGTDKTWLEYTEYMIINDLTKINSKIIRNEGYINSVKKD